MTKRKKKAGRPPTPGGIERITTTVRRGTKDRLATIGGGSVSAGIERLVADASEMKMTQTRIMYRDLTIELTRDNADQVRDLIDTMTAESADEWGPKIDAEKAAAVIVRGTQANPSRMAAGLRHYLCRLDYALSELGAYVVSADKLECERLAADPRAAQIKIMAYWGYGAEIPREMTLAEALRKHADYRNAAQPHSGVAATRFGIEFLPDDDDDMQGGEMESRPDRDPRPLLQVARELLQVPPHNPGE